MNKSIGIIGAGNVGTALAIALKRRGYSIAGVCCRTVESARNAAKLTNADYFLSPVEVSSRAGIIFITTPDGIIENMCVYLAENQAFREGQVVLHTSGAYSSTILKQAQLMGARTLSLHPLQTFPNVETGLKNIPGSYFTVEGDTEAVAVGSKLVSDLGGVLLTIPTEMKSLYHASACTVCNYLITIVDLGLKMMEAAGVSREKSLPALLPLVEGTLSNIKRVGIPMALTGPIERGDVTTVEKHISTMKAVMPGVIDLYGKLGAFTARVAREKGTLSIEQEEQICQALQSSPVPPL